MVICSPSIPPGSIFNQTKIVFKNNQNKILKPINTSDPQSNFVQINKQ